MNEAAIIKKLIRQGMVSVDQLKIAETEQQLQAFATPLSKILIKMGFVAAAVLRDISSDDSQYDSIDLRDIVIDSALFEYINEVNARQFNVLPIRINQRQQLLLAMSDAEDILIIDQLNRQLPAPLSIQPLLASDSEIQAAIENNYGSELPFDKLLAEINTGTLNQNEHPPLVHLVNNLLIEAVKRNASDIHFEPENTFLRIRYRIDGVLQQVRSLHKKHWTSINMRLKVMADLDVTETRQPQDGYINLKVAGGMVNFRVSSLPTIHSENIVLRILDQNRGIFGIEQLTDYLEQQQQLQQLLKVPEGIVLVTGPTGSGKTTTLYSLINALNSESVNIMTLEDPVEYKLDRIRQTNISRHLGFSKGLRAILRQDPDIILLGEIRDQETAQMAFRAAITGHQVFSTLHAPSAIAVIPRLLDMGVLPDMVVDNLNAVINQRLVRRLCSHCKQSYKPDAQLHEYLCEIVPDMPSFQHDYLYQAKGCEQCQHLGYKGRLALMDILIMTNQLKQKIAQQSNLFNLKRYLRQQQQTTLQQHALRCLYRGDSSLEEIQRVLFFSQNQCK